MSDWDNRSERQTVALERIATALESLLELLRRDLAEQRPSTHSKWTSHPSLVTR